MSLVNHLRNSRPLCRLARMTEQQAAGVIPAWTTGDRLRKARELAGMGQQEMADEIGISRRSVSAYEGGGSIPKRPVLLSWALRTGVPLEWLRSGTAETPRPGGDGGLERARYDSNVQPSDP